jgi:high potential iron-sulfur protein
VEINYCGEFLVGTTKGGPMSSATSWFGRREFLKRGAVVVTALPILGQLVSEARAQATPTTPLDPALPAAAALGYTHDATKVDTTKFPKHAGADGAKQVCNTCAFFSEGGKKLAGQPGEWGKCAIFNLGLANAQGWCNAWVPKPT